MKKNISLWRVLLVLVVLVAVVSTGIHYRYYLWPPSEEQLEALRVDLHSPSSFVRCETVIVLGKMGPRAIPVLTEALQDEEPQIREWAVRSLGQLGAESMSALEQAAKDQDRGVRQAALGALGTLGSDAQAALPTIRTALADSDRNIRDSAVCALGGIGPETIADLRVALKDQDAGIRCRAAMELGKMGPPAVEAVPAIKTACNDPDRKVRQFAEGALQQIQPLTVLHRTVNWVGRVFP